MKLPTHMTITCWSDGKAIAGLFIEFTLGVRHKNVFSLVVGPSNDKGQIHVSDAQILQSIKQDSSLFPMDYTGTGDLSGEIWVRPSNLQAIDQLLGAYSLFRGGYSYPEDYEQELEKSRMLLHQRKGALLSVVVTHDGENFRIHCEEAPV